ncbi:DUF3261 domain-containing protein [Telmatospirillum sp.]|uniref:DUF3261 domain-containing protein n=1 Tax=Telmatospirillum sp. TaxID=2079197 RepID=UPI00283B8596|nr:DUF3261 domain-containing protein [Telmatospirillum sp.]MDR3439088.1 DUF3261 domain-containing protein [Telmatospirillum sp.]
MFCRPAAFALIVLFLNSCAQHPVELPPGQVRIAPDVVMTLPKPSELGQSFEVAQLVTAHYGDRTFAFEGHLSATPDRFLLVGLDPMGHRALSITWTNETILTEKESWVPEQLRPANILADMVMLYWPEESLRRALSGSGGALRSAPRERTVSAGGKDVIRAEQPADGDDPWNGKATFSNMAWGYRLDIQSERLQ